MIEATTLVVDDEPMVRQLVRRILEAEVCRVVDAEDGEQALRLIQDRRETTNVVVTDLAMPGIDGGAGRSISPRRRSTSVPWSRSPRDGPLHAR